MYYPEEIIEEVRARTDIVDVVSQYVPLKGHGDEYKGLCPFHNEKTPSFHVLRSRQFFKCFGCGAGGNVYTFLMKHQNYTFPEAVQVLAQQAGVKLPEVQETAEQKRERSHRQRLYDVNRAAATFYYSQLRSERGEVGMRYLRERHMSDEMMQRFGLGYALQYNDALVKYLRGKGFEDRLILDAGLARYSEKYGMSDYFFNRVMYPYMDMNGRVIAFGARVMGEGQPKYLNSPETQIFEKGRNLYGLNYARGSRSGRIILCEGYMDVIALHQAGFTEAVASLGTAFTEQQAVLIRRFTKDVYLAYDSDRAGVGAALKALAILRGAGLTGRVIDMRPHKDPDEFLGALGAEAYEERIRGAENGFLYEIRQLRGAYDVSDPAQKTAFENEVALRLLRFEEKLERDNYLSSVAAQYGIDPKALQDAVVYQANHGGRARAGVGSMVVGGDRRPEQDGMPAPPGGARREKESGVDREARYAQRALLTWLCSEPSRYAAVSGYVTPEDFTDPFYQKIAKRVYQDLQAGEVVPAALINMFEEVEEQEQAAAVLETRIDALVTDEDKEKALHDVVVSVKKSSLEKLSAQAMASRDGIQRMIVEKQRLEKLQAMERIE